MDDSFKDFSGDDQGGETPATRGVPPTDTIGTRKSPEPVDRNNIITARGTAEGLVLRVDGRVDPQQLRGAVVDFVEARRTFLACNDVSFEWVGAKPEESFVQELCTLLQGKFKITVRNSRLRAKVSKTILDDEPGAPTPALPITPTGITQAGVNPSIKGSGQQKVIPTLVSKDERLPSLFDGIEPEEVTHVQGQGLTVAWDDPDARIVYGTLRSGQKIETEHSVVVMGDVNSGAEIIAGGDIVILGTLRGIAHAGAFDETGGGRVIFALSLQPTQLRIGTVISRGGPYDVHRGAEIARVDNNSIVVESYQVRGGWSRAFPRKGD